MAATQSINCIKCGKVLGTLDCTSGDFHAIHFIADSQGDTKRLDEKVKEQKPNSRSDFNQALEAKNKYRKQRDPQGNLSKDPIALTCGCGQLNKIS